MLADGRSGHTFVIDTKRERGILFGGKTSTHVLNDTWEWRYSAIRQEDWRQVLSRETPGPRFGHATAYDPVRDRIVLFGGTKFVPFYTYEIGYANYEDTWEFDGDEWHCVKTRSGVPKRIGHTMVFDPNRRKVILFGGMDQGPKYYEDMWEWDGQNWNQIPFQQPWPQRRAEHAMAVGDNARVIMHGGFLSIDIFGSPSWSTYEDTWEWNGRRWLLLREESALGPRRQHSMVYDSFRKSLLLTSGVTGSVEDPRYHDDLWRWTGNDWSEEPVSNIAGPTSDQTFAYFEGKGIAVSICYGGYHPRNGYLHDSRIFHNRWERYDQAFPQYRPERRELASFFWHSESGSSWVFGGRGGYDEFNDIWAWNGRTWINKTRNYKKPQGRFGAAVTYHASRDRTVLFGGDTAGWYSDETWQHLDTSGPGMTGVVDWHQEQTQSSPSARAFAQLIYIPTKEHSFLFGGVERIRASELYRGGPWLWNGNQWILLRRETYPAPRYGHMMVYDSARDRVVLFAGKASDRFLEDTWEWDGLEWHKMSPRDNPGKRIFAGMVFNTDTGKTILYGGEYTDRWGDTFLKDDVWQWDGTNWERIDDWVLPGKRSRHGMVYDPNRSAVVVYGGVVSQHGSLHDKEVRGDVWELIERPTAKPTATPTMTNTATPTPMPTGTYTPSPTPTPTDTATPTPIPATQELSGHESAVTSVSFSSDGQKILTGSRDHTAKLWEITTGEPIQTFSGHTTEVSTAALSPDGTQLLTGSLDTTARLWDAVTAKVIQIYSHKAFVFSVAFSPDGSQVLVGDSLDRAVLWDALRRKVLAVYTGHKDDVMSVALSPDGTQVLTGSKDNSATLWDRESGKSLQNFLGHGEGVNSVAFSPDGERILTGSEDATARIWEKTTGSVIETLADHGAGVNAAVFSPDGKWILTGSSDGTARLWDAQNANSIETFSAHNRGVNSVAFSPDGAQILTGSEDGIARLWNIIDVLPTPTPTATPTNTPTPTPTFTATPTPWPTMPVPHPPVPDYSNVISEPDLSGNGISEFPGTFAGLEPAVVSVTDLPPKVVTTTELKGMFFVSTLSPNRGLSCFLPSRIRLKQTVRYLSVCVSGSATPQPRFLSASLIRMETEISPRTLGWISC